MPTWTAGQREMFSVDHAQLTGETGDWPAVVSNNTAQIAAPSEGPSVIDDHSSPGPTVSPRWRLAAAVATLVLLAAATVSAVNVDGDTGGDLLAFGRLIGRDLLRLRWQFAAVLIMLAGLHYVAAAIAARAASGARLPLGEAVLVQFAASAADRLTPGGLGGAAVNARYFTRRGLTFPAALGAVVSLHILGPITDIALLAFLVLAGRWVGLNGGAHEFQALTTKIANMIAPLRSPWSWLAIAILLATAVLLRRLRTSRPGRDWTTFWSPLRDLSRHLVRLATLACASGATTLILAFAFAASVALVPGPRPVAALGALLIAFMLGTAAGTALPIPAGVGTTEAALIAVLVGMHVPSALAVQQVLVFRVVTFWLPAAVGVFATHHLRRRAAL
ncbi:lysylphosphatidylglycerol synthase transmembrane domain-containing protein [Jatrophihabitans sp. DSM 45814]